MSQQHGGWAPPPGGGYGPPPPNPYAMQQYSQGPMAPFHCRSCGYAGNAMVVEQISTGGWVVFVLMFLSFFLFLFCWIPLITMKDRRSQCPNCRVLVG